MTVKSDIAVLVNESDDPDVPGDVSLFRSIADAEQWLEPVDVRNGEYFAYTLDGRELGLTIESGCVKIVSGDAGRDFRARVRNLLEAAARSAVAAAVHRGKREIAEGAAHLSLEQLIALIGYT